MIKKALTILAVALAIPLAAPKAEAGHPSVSITFRSGHASCGCPTYTRRHFRGYNSCRQPIFHYSRLAVRHGSSCRHRAVHHRRPIVHRPAYNRSWISTPRISIRSHNYRHRGHSRGYGRGRSCR